MAQLVVVKARLMKSARGVFLSARVYSHYHLAMSDIFVSFADEERHVALALKDLLQTRMDGVSIFLTADRWQMLAGERWLDRIETELRAAKVVVLVLTQKSVYRPWINFEAGAAWLKGALVIPACFGSLRVRELPKPYNDLLGVQLEERDDVYFLQVAVAKALSRIPPPPEIADTPEFLALTAAIGEVARTDDTPIPASAGDNKVAEVPSVEEVSILEMLTEFAPKVNVDAVMKRLSIKREKAEYYLDRLREQRLIGRTDRYDNGSPLHYLTQQGREILVRKGRL